MDITPTGAEKFTFKWEETLSFDNIDMHTSSPVFSAWKKRWSVFLSLTITNMCKTLCYVLFKLWRVKTKVPFPQRGYNPLASVQLLILSPWDTGKSLQPEVPFPYLWHGNYTRCISVRFLQGPKILSFWWFFV